MALPALRTLPHLLAVSDDVLRGSRGPSDVQGRAGRLLVEISIRLRRIGAVYCQLILDVLDDGETIRQGQLIPGRHRGAAHSTGDRPQQVAIGRHRLLGQPELEHAQGEVSRALIEDEGRSRPVAVAFGPVAADAPPLIDLLAVGDPFVRAREGGVRDRQLLRLEHVAPLAAIHAKLLHICNEALELFRLSGNLDRVARVLLIWCPHDRKLAARLHRNKQQPVRVRRELDLLLSCEIE